jgi:hypothetical protein
LRFLHFVLDSRNLLSYFARVTNQPVPPAPATPSGKHPDTDARGRYAAKPKRGSNPGDAMGGKNPMNRKAGPGRR